MSSEKALKTQNIPSIIIFLVLNIALYTVFYVGFKDFWQELVSQFNIANAKNGLVAAITPALSFALTGLISPGLKANIVFWKKDNPLPGSRAFTEVAPKDVRIDMNVLKKKVKKLPVEPGKQNRAWYKIYKEVADTPTVELAHKHFLLARELATVSLLLLVATPWPILLIAKNAEFAGIYVLVLLAEFIVFCVVGQNTGKRFVANVLAEYCCK